MGVGSIPNMVVAQIFLRVGGENLTARLSGGRFFFLKMGTEWG